MVVGWRRAFCTSVTRDRESKESKEMQEPSSNTPRIASKLSFSNPSAPRLQSQPVSSARLRCRTVTEATVPTSSFPESPKLQCKTTNSPRFFHRSTPSSPRSPCTFSLLKSSLRLCKSRCRICLHSVKKGQGTAIFTAECSHSFHFACIAAQVKKQGSLACPVCCYIWKELPVLTMESGHKPEVTEKRPEQAAKTEKKQHTGSDLKVYNDDEPLMSPTAGALFNPIPESDENGDEDTENENRNIVQEFKGFFTDSNSTVSRISIPTVNCRNVEVMLLQEAAVLSTGRSSETYAIVLKVKAPPSPARNWLRPPIDLVTVLDVGSGMTSDKVLMMKRTMRLVVSSLSSTDRLSIVAFSANSKRLLPLRRMTATGRLSARRIIDAIVACHGTSSANDALKKASKVLEDRRERNPVAIIFLLSDGGHATAMQRSQASIVSSTRSASLETPVHYIRLGHGGAFGEAPFDDAFAKSVSSLLSVVVQDLRIQLGFASGSAPAGIVAVYSCSGRPVVQCSGSIRFGDLHAEEERELLVELKVPSLAVRTHHVLSVRCFHRDPSTHEMICGNDQCLFVPRPHAVRSSNPSIQRMRSLFVSARALAESRHLIERNDLSGAYHMLTSARGLLLQCGAGSPDYLVHSLEAELANLQSRRQQLAAIHRRRTSAPATRTVATFVDEKGEPLTPTSAWKAAERLAKIAILAKSMNRVSDLHGFENARF